MRKRVGGDFASGGKGKSGLAGACVCGHFMTGGVLHEAGNDGGKFVRRASHDRSVWGQEVLTLPLKMGLWEGKTGRAPGFFLGSY